MATATRKNGIYYVELEGTPYEMGQQHGTALRNQVVQSVADYRANVEEMFGQSFARTRGDQVDSVGFGCGLNERFPKGVILVEYAGVIEVLLDPVAQETETAKVDHEAVGVGFFCSESQPDRPVVPVYQRAVAGVPMLPMGERNIRVSLGAGEHLSVRVGTRRLIVEVGLTQTANSLRPGP